MEWNGRLLALHLANCAKCECMWSEMEWARERNFFLNGNEKMFSIQLFADEKMNKIWNKQLREMMNTGKSIKVKFCKKNCAVCIQRALFQLEWYRIYLYFKVLPDSNVFWLQLSAIETEIKPSCPIDFCRRNRFFFAVQTIWGGKCSKPNCTAAELNFRSIFLYVAFYCRPAWLWLETSILPYNHLQCNQFGLFVKEKKWL